MRTRYCNNTGIEDVSNVLVGVSRRERLLWLQTVRCSFIAGTKLSLFYVFMDMKLITANFRTLLLYFLCAH